MAEVKESPESYPLMSINFDYSNIKKQPISNLNNEEHKVQKSDDENKLQDLDVALSYLKNRTFDEIASMMKDCLSTGDVKLAIMEQGDGPLVPMDAKVTLHYSAFWEKEDIPFDSTLVSNRGAPLKVCLGIGKLLPGLEVGLTQVRGPSARFCLLLTPKVTWSELGALPRIRPERALFLVHLLEVLHAGSVERFNNLPSSEQQKVETIINTATASNSFGKEFFNKGNVNKALMYYKKSLYILKKNLPENDSEVIKALLSKVYINLAICYTKLNEPELALRMLDDLGPSVAMESRCKRYYYYGKALQMLGDYEEAMDFFMKALKVESKNKDVTKSIAEVDAVISQLKKKEVSMWKNVFGAKNSSKPVDRFDNIPEDFKDAYRRMCQHLMTKENYTEITLPKGLQIHEIEFITELIKGYADLHLITDSNSIDREYVLMKNAM